MKIKEWEDRNYRLESEMSKNRDQSKNNDKKIAKLEENLKAK